MTQLNWRDVPIPDVRDIAWDSLPSDERTIEGWKEGVKAGIEYALSKFNEPHLTIAREPSDDILVASIEIALVLTKYQGENAERVDVDFEGGPTRLQALGMLRMAEAQVLDEGDA